LGLGVYKAKNSHANHLSELQNTGDDRLL
jgi:hypothetical protein